MDKNKAQPVIVTGKAQRDENVQACKALYKAQVKAKATEDQLRDTYSSLVRHCIEGIALRCNKVEQFSQKKCMIDTIKDSLKECDIRLNPHQESLLSAFCEWRTKQFEKKANEEDQKKACEECLKQSIGPFVKELLLANTPKELETLQQKYELEQEGQSDVLQQLRGKFFNPLELVWFDPKVHSDENKFYTEILQDDLKIKVNTFTKFEEAVQFIQKDGRDRRLLLISCGSMGQELCDRISMDINVIFVYIFSFQVEQHREWATKYYKIQGIYTDIFELLQSIKTQEFVESDSSLIFKRSTESFAFFKALDFFKEWALDQQMTDQVKSLDVLESLLHIQSLNKANILEPYSILTEEVFKRQQNYERDIDFDNHEEIIKIYTKKDVFPKLNAQLRFSKRDMFLLSAQIISSKISNALMIKQNEDPTLAYVGTCYRGINITRHQLNQFTEHLKNIITFSAFTSSTVSETEAIRFMLDFDDRSGANVDASKELKQVNLDERVPILLQFKVKKENAAMQSMIDLEELKDDSSTLEDKLRPIDISRFSKYSDEREILFAPLSSFKIDSLPLKIEHDSGIEYYQIMLEYIDTFIPTKQMMFMNVTNAFSQLNI